MKSLLPKKYPGRKESGQSFVEFVIALPILVFLLAGVVEVANLLNTQTRLTTAARIGAGYGASNYDENDWPGTADSMGDVVINTVTETLDLSTNLWDVWSAHALVNPDGTDFAVFETDHVYGDNIVIPAGDWPAMEAEVRSDMLTELQSTGIESAKNIEVVASVAFHDIDTIIGLPIWQWTGLQTLRGITVMRVGEKAAFIGCPLLPITIRLNQYSLYPTNWEGGPLHPELEIPALPDPIDTFPPPDTPRPWGGGGGCPDDGSCGPIPTYNSTMTDTLVIPDTHEFYLNEPGVPMHRAQKGYLYWARQVITDSAIGGGFGWLTWTGDPNSPELEDNLVDPDAFLKKYPGSDADMGTTGHPPPPDIDGSSATGDSDGRLEPWWPAGTGGENGPEWLQNASGTMNGVAARNATESYVTGKVPVTMMVYDLTNGDAGSGMNYRAWRLAEVRMVGFNFSGNNKRDKWILFEFLRWIDKCETQGDA